MGMNELLKDKFFVKFIQRTARMLGEWYQQKAPTMTNDELYEESEFFPLYSAEKDYSDKADGYVCRAQDGTMMRLVHSGRFTFYTDNEKVTSIRDVNATSSIVWKSCWSTDPKRAREFISSELSAYGKDECCIYNEEVYRCLSNEVVQSPEESPEDWERVEM